MTSPEYSHHFSLNNLPYGVASSPVHPQQCATRLHNTVIFLGALQKSGFFNGVSSLPNNIFAEHTLNAFAALPNSIHAAVRTHLQSALQPGVESLPANSTADITAVTMHLPVSIGGFTDFSCSLNHVQNAGRAILNDPSPPPGFFHFPIGYGGRASTVAVSGTPIIRPNGHFYDRTSPTPKTVIYGPSRALDYEMELGAVIGRPLEREKCVKAKDAEEHIFGFVILNDWSARDIQGLEMIPLGPLNGKAFGSTISPWIVTIDALSPFKAPGPEPRVTLPDHLQEERDFNYDINMSVELLHPSNETKKDEIHASTIATSLAKDLFWSHRQMAAHLASSGCDLRTGDLLGTGTVSGPVDGSFGCLLESTKGGKETVKLVDGSERVYLRDGDVVRMSAVVGAEGSGVGFGECVGEVLPARVY
ncbi:fumarylacetoacetate hydrolase family protein [Aspergillus lucknowensis]|uniref:Fumarylacetoacetase n=1 Tax=Aspergillus lucknowensis TaxID=176173 RepID=A0ABR4L8A2_9EURO